MKEKELTEEELNSVTGGNLFQKLFGGENKVKFHRVNPSDGCDSYEQAYGKTKDYKCNTCKYYNGHYVCTNPDYGTTTGVL